MSYTGIKGIDFLDAVWDIAEGIHTCSEDCFEQHFLGGIECSNCQQEVISQEQVDILEKRGLLVARNDRNEKKNLYNADGPESDGYISAQHNDNIIPIDLQLSAIQFSVMHLMNVISEIERIISDSSDADKIKKWEKQLVEYQLKLKSFELLQSPEGSKS